MKKLMLVGVALGLLVAGAYAVKWNDERVNGTITVTTASGGNSSAKIDTVWFNRTKIGDLMPYARYYMKVRVGKFYEADTAQGAHRYGLRDTISIAIKKKMDDRIVLIDSSLYTVALGSAVCSTLAMLSPINDTMWAKEIFATIRIADSQADTAGLSLRARTYTELYVKE